MLNIRGRVQKCVLSAVIISRLLVESRYQAFSTVWGVSSAKSCSAPDNYSPHKYHRIFPTIFIEVTMKKTIRNKAVFALSLLFLSNITYSSEEKNKLDEVMLYFTLSQCSEYVIGNQHPDRTLEENITTYLDYLRINKKDVSLLS